MMKWGKLILKITIGLIVIFFAEKALADNSTIYINEVMWSGSNINSSDEWIELYNLSDNQIDISGWKINNAARSNGQIVIPENTQVSPKSYYLIAKYPDGSDKSNLNTTADFVCDNLSLKDEDNGNLELIDTDENIVDQIDGINWPAGNKDTPKSSAERINYGDGLDASNWQSSYRGLNLKDDINNLATPRSDNNPKIFKEYDQSFFLDSEYINTNNILYTKAKVTYVIDGDTLEVKIGSLKQRVRLIGIDAPENADHSDYNIDEPYYQESLDYLIGKLYSKEVYLLVNKNNNDRYDNYNRLLAVVIDNGDNANIDLLNIGYARTYYIDNQAINKTSWIKAEEFAKNNHLGIWNNFNNSCLEISELFPNPSGLDSQDEWIELYNNCNASINLKNYIIDDSEKGSYPYLIDEDIILEANQYIDFKITQTNIALNNTSDELRIFDSALNIIDWVSYTQTYEDKSYAKINGQFIWTATPTQGKKNVYNDEDHQYEKINNLDDLAKQEKGNFVEIEGYVNSEPKMLAKQYFYIQDSTGAAQIYNYYGNFPSLTIGDYVKVLGQLSDAGIIRVKIEKTENIKILYKESFLEAQKISLAKVNSKIVGTLVEAQGTATKLSGQTFYIQDGQYLLKISIKDYTGFKRPNLSSGDKVIVTGILHMTSNKNYQLLPRFFSDILIISLKKDIYKKLDNLAETKNCHEDQKIIVKGYVNSLPNTLDKRYFYIQDSTYGVQIYSYNKLFPDLNIGDYVEVKGILSSSLQRIKTYSENDITIISRKNTVESENNPDNVDDLFGRLVYIQGKIISKDGDKIYVSNGNIVYTIFLKSNTQIKSSIFVKNAFVSLYGVVESYKDGNRICPRTQSDIQIFEQAKEDKNKLANYTNKKTKIIFSKSAKYLEKAPEKEYNMITIKNITIATVIFLQLYILYFSIKVMTHVG